MDKHDLVGMYGHWLALPGNEVRGKHRYQLVRCTLCNETERHIRVSTLKDGKSTKCRGCMGRLSAKDISDHPPFGRLTALYPTDKRSSSRNVIWACKCSCGNPENVEVSLKLLTSGKTQSCGCLNRETASVTGVANVTHNMSHTRLYNVHSGMRRRCLNKNVDEYKRYGGRGIIIIDDLLKFEDFMEFALENGWYEGCHMHRPDNDGNYSKNNLVFISAEEHNEIHWEQRRRAA